jgi:hypothetical protein
MRRKPYTVSLFGTAKDRPGPLVASSHLICPPEQSAYDAGGSIASNALINDATETVGARPLHGCICDRSGVIGFDDHLTTILVE